MEMIINKIKEIVRTLRYLRFKWSNAYLEQDFWKMYAKARLFTMTPGERMYALYKACEYISLNHIPGDVVECGVYRGGSMMLAASALLARKDGQRRLFLYDTFAGMAQPTDKDISLTNQAALQTWQKKQTSKGSSWCLASLEEVKHNMLSTGYPEDKVIFVKGKVEDTLPRTIPERIALLRLDTDWYASTYHELVHLFPRIVEGGVIIIDDYGHWQGAREAVDQYIKEKGVKILLNRIDYSARIAIKTS